MYKADLSLIHAVDVEVLHLLVRVIGFTVADSQLIKPFLGNFNVDRKRSSLLVKIGEAASGKIGEVHFLAGAVLLSIPLPALGIDLSAGTGPVLKFVFQDSFICRFALAHCRVN